MKLEERQWNEFRIGDFFEVKRGKRIVKDVDFLREKTDDYTYPVVTAATTNNSIDGYYNKHNCPKNSIVCGGEAGGFFATYQEEECWVMDRSRIFTPKMCIKNKINKFTAFFLITIFKKEMFKYSYGRSANPTHIENTIVKLPVNDNDIDWEFMENYMKEIWGGYLETSIPYVELDTNIEGWKEYKLSQLFDVMGTKTTKVEVLENYGPGKYPYVTTQATNNGVCDFYDYYTEEGNVLTIDSATIGYCSYQEENFSASDHVEKLIPKFQLNKYIALFLVAIINKNQFKFSYGRKCNQKQIRNIEIMIPIDILGQPDWLFMEKYIKQIQFADLI